MLRVCGLAVCVAVLAPVEPAQPQKPDFSGTWIFVPDRSTPDPSPSPGGMAPALSEFTATQDATSLTIAWTVNGTPFSESYLLDGTEKRRTTLEVVIVTKAVWEKNTIAITTLRTGETPRLEGRRVISLNGDGTLQVDVTSRVAQKTTRWRSVYRKSYLRHS